MSMRLQYFAHATFLRARRARNSKYLGLARCVLFPICLDRLHLGETLKLPGFQHGWVLAGSSDHQGAHPSEAIHLRSMDSGRC
jgi:hypothetical protein